jgi:hypothetical protein
MYYGIHSEDNARWIWGWSDWASALRVVDMVGYKLVGSQSHEFQMRMYEGWHK